MKEIILTRNQVTIVDDRDYEKLNRHKWYAYHNGYKFYAVRWSKVSEGWLPRKMIFMHREILQTPSNMETDHISGSSLDNRRGNLRVATRSENAANVRRKTGYKGLCWDKRRKKFMAYIQKECKSKFLGYFETRDEAAIAHNKAAKTIHGNFACLNQIMVNQGGLTCSKT